MRCKTRKLGIQKLEDRAIPAFGFGSAFSIGGASFDQGTDIALDAVGNAYVSGFYSGTVDFDPGAGTAFLTSGPDSNGFVAKYLSNGTFQWATDLGPGGGANLAVDGANVFVGSGGLHNGITTSITASRLDASNGAVVWSSVVEAAPASGNALPGIAVSPSGSVLVSCNNSAAQALLTSLDSAGVVQWTRTSNGGAAIGSGIALDASGNIVVSGTFTGSVTFGSTTLNSQAGSQDVFTWKLNSSGASVWAGGVGGIGTDYGGAIAVDSAGNTFLTGAWGNATNINTNNDFNPGGGVSRLTHNGGYFDIFIVKLAPGTGGSLVYSWAKGIGGPNGGSLPQHDFGKGITIDSGGNVYTTGHFSGTVDFDPGNKKSFLTANSASNGNTDAFVLKLNSGGNFVAAAAMGGSGPDWGRKIDVDGAGNVWTTGQFNGVADFNPTAGTFNLTANGIQEIFVSRLTQSGALRATGPFAAGQPVVSLTAVDLKPIIAAAIDRWAAAGLDAGRLKLMRQARFTIGDLGGSILGLADTMHGIRIDDDAAGHGWFVDRSPRDDREFFRNDDPRMRGRIDLLSTVAHELGHFVGLDHHEHDGVMGETLPTGVRRMPTAAEVGELVPVVERRMRRR